MDYVAFLLDLYLYLFLYQHFEEGAQEGEQFLAIQGFVPVDVEEVQDIFHVVLGRGIGPHQVGEHLHDLRELPPGEAPVPVLVELAEYLFLDGSY